MQRLNTAVVQHLELFDLCLACLHHSRQRRSVQTDVDVYGHCILVLATCRRDSSVDERDQRESQLSRNSQQQTQLIGLHVGRHGHDEPAVCSACHGPHLLKLATHKISRAEMAEAPVNQWGGIQRRPVTMLYATGIDARPNEC